MIEVVIGIVIAVLAWGSLIAGAIYAFSHMKGPDDVE